MPAKALGGFVITVQSSKPNKDEVTGVYLLDSDVEVYTMYM